MKILLPLSLSLSIAANLIADYKEYPEDAYLSPAPASLVQTAEKVAQTIGYTQPYEVAIPKNPALEINPWNKFVGSGTNPHTKNGVIIINPEWAQTLTPEQLDFLLARSFIHLQRGLAPFSMKIVPWIFVLIGLCIALVLAVYLPKKFTFARNPWMRFALVVVILASIDLTLFKKMITYTNQKLIDRHSKHVNEEAMLKASTKETAIASLQAYDTAIKNELAHGEKFFQPFADTFEKQADALKNS